MRASRLLKFFVRNLLGAVSRFRWRVLWASRSLLVAKPKPEGQSENEARLSERPQNLVAIYINLDRRLDRRREIERELEALGLAPERFPAVDGRFVSEGSPNPVSRASLACAISHSEVLAAQQTLDRAVMVCEDDLMFMVGRERVFELLREFFADPRLDVLCLANNVADTPLAISENLCISQNISTTACYVVKPRALALLESNFAESVALLAAGAPVQKGSLDQHWKKLQKGTLYFAVPRKRVARQRPSKSDITGRLEDRGL